MIPTPIIQVFDATGSTALGVLAAVESVQISDVLSDLGSLQLSAPLNVAGMELLVQEQDRQLAVMIPGCPVMWFLLDEDEPRYISDDSFSESATLTMRSLAGVLDEARVYPSTGLGAGPAEYAFTDATPGAIVKALFAAAQTRGGLQGISLANAASLATLDAAGAAWPDTVTQTFKAGTTLLEVLRSLADLGLIEWRMNARSLEIYTIEGGLDRTLPQVVLRPRRDVIDATFQRSRRDIYTSVLVEGNEGATTDVTHALAGRRVREGYVSTQVDAAALSQVGSLYLSAHAASAIQMTHELTDGYDTPWPWRDYRPGDRVPTMAAGNGVTVQRVAQIALSYDADGARVSLELGSIAKTAEERFDRQLRKLTPGDTA